MSSNNINPMFELDIGEIWLKGKIEVDRLNKLHTEKEPFVKDFPNGFKKFYCPNCNEEFYKKKTICFCRQRIRWSNEQHIWY